MGISGIIALLVCVACVGAKFLFAVRIRNLERVRTQETETFREAKTELHQSKQKSKRLEAESKQIEARTSSSQRNIENMNKTLKELDIRKQEDDAVRAHQETMIKNLRSK